jgi:hypothetical protein
MRSPTSSGSAMTNPGHSTSAAPPASAEIPSQNASAKKNRFSRSSRSDSMLKNPNAMRP